MEEKKMKIDQTNSQVHLLYTYTGGAVINDVVYNCFKLADDYALVLRLPWSDYTLTFPWDATRPLKPGDTVSVIYVRTHSTTPKLMWKPVGWYAI